MQIAVLTCLISLLPAILSAPDDGCPMCDRHNPLRCGPNCLQVDDQDAEFEIDPSRQGEVKVSTKSSKYGTGRDLICLNFPQKGKYGRLDTGLDGFIINKGKFMSLRELLEIANSNQGFKGDYKNPFDMYRDSSDLKQTLDVLGGIVSGRQGNWGKLSPPWG